MKRRIIFVGIHNKPGKSPLDSSTRSGKVIDACLKELTAYECIKSNLFNRNSMPLYPATIGTHVRWRLRISWQESDIIVLLGGHVHRNFKNSGLKHTIKMRHPSSWAGKHDTTDNFVLDLLIKLEAYFKRENKSLTSAHP